jgi:hypothetical protein
VLAALLSLILVAHFAFSSYIWVQVIAHDWSRFNVLVIYWPDWFVPLLLMGLALWSVVRLISRSPLTRKRLAAANRMAVLTIVTTCCFFAVDVCLGRYQVSIDIATKEYWDGGGAEHVYYTWWWFNDRWVHASRWQGLQLL